MRQTRCFVDLPLAVGAHIQLPGTVAHHLGKVLRLGAGAPVVLFNGSGGEYLATLSGNAKSLCADVSEHVATSRESGLQTTLIQALAKGDRLDTAIQKATELGVSRIQLLPTERSTLKLNAERRDKKLAHWLGVATHAAEQSGRTRVPEVSWIDSLPPVPTDTLGLLLAPNAARPLADRLSNAGTCTPVWLLVGPEGGLSDAEIERATTLGWQPTLAGPRVLRTETAGPALLAVLQALRGDWRENPPATDD